MARGVVAAALTLLLLAVACVQLGDRRIEIMSARLVDDATLDIAIGACQADAVVAVTEADESVQVDVVDRGRRRPLSPLLFSPLCQDGIRLTLDEPLNDRILVDGFDGSVVDVQPSRLPQLGG